MERQSKKQKKIFRKIFLPIVHILLIFAVATSVVSYFLVDRFVKENARQKVEEAYNDVQNQLNAFEASGEKTFTLLPSDNLINQSNNTRVYVYDKDFTEIALFDNTIYIDSEMTDFISELLSNFELDENVLTTIRFNNREYLANTYVASDRLDIKEKYFVVVQDLTDKAVLLRTNMRNMLIVQFIVLLITIITSFIVARDLSRPLIKLSKESEDYVIGKGITIDDEEISTKELEGLRLTLKKMQNKIEEETSKKNTIYENVAHDLRTPLVSILGYADGLKSGIIKDKNKACDIILRTGNQLKEMIENILVLSRFDNDTYKGNIEEVNLVDLIDEQVETVRVIDDNVKVIFENKLSEIVENKNDGIISAKYQKAYDQDNIAVISSDRKLLIRIIQNLLSNAIKYAKTKVIISLSYVVESSNLENSVDISSDLSASESSQKSLSHFRIVVSDDGEGIDSSNIDNIFTRYYKGEDGHFGIGLAVVKSSVDYIGGKIKVESEKGKGTSFIVSL